MKWLYILSLCLCFIGLNCSKGENQEMQIQRAQLNSNKVTIDIKENSSTLNSKSLIILLENIGQEKIELAEGDLFIRISFVYYDGSDDGFSYNIIQYSNDTSFKSSYSRFNKYNNEIKLSNQVSFLPNWSFALTPKDTLMNNVLYLINNLEEIDTYQVLKSSFHTYFEAYLNGTYTQYLLDFNNLCDTKSGAILADIIETINASLKQNSLQDKYANKLINDLKGD
ncbi:MAG: hypothetical protein IPI65_13105 [Bacteroidetes bacterium]|nr:hypothetical protein [Bacteroidota bacterium]